MATGELDKAKLDPKERALLDYVEVLTLRPAQISDALVEGLRKKGWKDEEIFEGTFVTAIFAFFNRMSDAFGLDYAPGGWRPQQPPPGAAAAPK